MIAPEERVRRVKAALAEAGYPDAGVRWGHMGAPAMFSPLPPPEVRWRAYRIAGEATEVDDGGLPMSCWPCYAAQFIDGTGLAADCDHDPLTSPWPEVVR